jgi:hypothetical protein
VEQEPQRDAAPVPVPNVQQNKDYEKLHQLKTVFELSIFHLHLFYNFTVQ